MSGIALLPYSDHSYPQAPYQAISKQEYEERTAEMPKIDWEMLSQYEVEDHTVGSQELACVGTSCELPN